CCGSVPRARASWNSAMLESGWRVASRASSTRSPCPSRLTAKVIPWTNTSEETPGTRLAGASACPPLGAANAATPGAAAQAARRWTPLPDVPRPGICNKHTQGGCRGTIAADRFRDLGSVALAHQRADRLVGPDPVGRAEDRVVEDHADRVEDVGGD